jgi:hypothetical protein
MRDMRIGYRDDLASTHPFGTGLQTSDRLLAENREPPLGSHLVTPRRGYLHHGIYIGGCKVVHYSGPAHGLRGGPVRGSGACCLRHFGWFDGRSRLEDWRLLQRLP